MSGQSFTEGRQRPTGILICDMIAAQLIATPLESFVGIYLKSWRYDIDFGLGKSPLGIPWEVQIGYCIIVFWYATTMRVWNRKMDGEL